MNQQPPARDEQHPTFLLPRLVIAAVFIGIAALIITVGGVS